MEESEQADLYPKPNSDRSKTKALLVRVWNRLDIILFFVFIPICFGVALYTGFHPLGRAAGACLLIVFFWVFLVLPLPVTSLLPIFVFPAVGVLSSDETCSNYFKDLIFLLMGGITIALALEYSQLHRRFALYCLKMIGTSEKMLLLGFMFPTCLLSMIINNTSTTAIMLPIADAVFLEMARLSEPDEEFSIPENIVIAIERKRRARIVAPGASDSIDRVRDLSKESSKVGPSNSSVIEEPLQEEESRIQRPAEPENTRLQYEKECIFISIAMAANLGGTGTVIGTIPNVYLIDRVAKIGKRGEALNYFSWMLFSIPNLILCILGAWIWLLGYFYGFKKLFLWKDKNPERTKTLSEIINRRYRKLGKLSHYEIIVIMIFILVSITWITRKPGFVDGWSVLMFPNSNIGDATVGIFFGLLLVIIPRRFDFFCFQTSNSSKDYPASPCVMWKIIHEKMPWSALLVIGCGMCLSDAIDKSGLTIWIANHLQFLKVMNRETISVLSLIIVIIMTSLMANTIVVSIILPILDTVSIALKIHPLYLMLPATICASNAFMFPFSTSSNTLVFEWANLKASRLFGQGLGLNIICGIIMIILINTLGIVLYDLNTYPMED